MITTIENKSTGYYHDIHHLGKYPRISTIKKYIEASKAEGCKGEVKITQYFDGWARKLTIVDTGKGEEILSVESSLEDLGFD
jgi:hypothetical protein